MTRLQIGVFWRNRLLFRKIAYFAGKFAGGLDRFLEMV
jgi:hypothetical protein